MSAFTINQTEEIAMKVQYVGPFKYAPKGTYVYAGVPVLWKRIPLGEEVLIVTEEIPDAIGQYICEGTEAFVPFEKAPVAPPVEQVEKPKPPAPKPVAKPVAKK